METQYYGGGKNGPQHIRQGLFRSSSLKDHVASSENKARQQYNVQNNNNNINNN